MNIQNEESLNCSTESVGFCPFVYTCIENYTVHVYLYNVMYNVTVFICDCVEIYLRYCLFNIYIYMLKGQGHKETFNDVNNILSKLRL